jgi:hypothetical protein
MLWRKRLHAGKSEGELRVHGLFDPQSTVVIEGCDSLILRHKGGTALACDIGDKLRDGSLAGTVVPRRERILSRGVRTSQ